MMAIRRWFFLLPVILMLSGCSLLPASPPVTFYRLPPPSLAASAAPKAAFTLRVNRPEASGLLAGNRILVVPQDNQLSAYQGVRWASPVPILWRDQLIDTFQQDGRIRHISGDAGALQADLELGGSLRAFNSEYRQGRPVVIIRFDAQLVDPRDRQILASRRFEVIEPAPSVEVPAVVEAFGVAHERLARELLDWLLTTRRP